MPPKHGLVWRARARGAIGVGVVDCPTQLTLQSVTSHLQKKSWYFTYFKIESESAIYYSKCSSCADIIFQEIQVTL